MKNLKQCKRLLTLFCASTFFISCTSVSKFSTAKTLDITPIIVQKPTVADMKVNETKVTGTFSGKITSISLENIKNEAIAGALKSVNADLLIEPSFQTTISSGKTTVTVTGFPATFTNFRTMKNEDIPLMQIGSVRQVNAFVPPTMVAKKSKAGKTLLITIGVIGGLAAVIAGVAGSQ